MEKLWIPLTPQTPYVCRMSGDVIAACNELGGLYRVLSRYDEGMPLYEKALKRMQRYGYILERFISPEGYFPYIILSSDGT